MSIAGFKSSNHPQQTAKRGASDQVDDRGTDPVFMATLEERFGRFDLDVAAAPHNAKAPSYYTRDDDGLSRDWHGRVWCNPPYSDCGAWVRKSWEQWAPGRGDVLGDPAPDLIVMLLPANRVEQAWWQDHVEPYRDRPGSPLRVEFLRGRMRFDRPDWTPGPKGDRPPFGCCLLIWGTADHAYGPTEGGGVVSEMTAEDYGLGAGWSMLPERQVVLCRTCMRPLNWETRTEPGFNPRTGWYDDARSDPLTCFKSADYQHVPLTDREWAYYRAGQKQVIAALETLRDGWDATRCGVTSPGLRRAVDDLDREWFDQTTQRKQGEANREALAHPSTDPDG